MAGTLAATSLAGGESEGELALLPVSPGRFQARWNLPSDALDRGRRRAAAEPERSQLVLRAFDLPGDRSDYGSARGVHDFPVDGPAGSAYFELSHPAARIAAVIGLRNPDGRFSPLIHGQVVALPAPPPPAPQPEPEEKAPEPAESVEASFRGAGLEERLAALAGLPDELRDPPRAAAENGTQPPPPVSRSAPIHRLDEARIIENVRRRLAADPEPRIRYSQELAERTAAPAPGPGTAEEGEAGASEQLASQWESLWDRRSPVELRAELVMAGRIADGFRLLLGAEAVEPSPGGRFAWRRSLRSFSETWPLLRPALETPVIPAGPALEFARATAGGSRVLELHAAVEIEGRITDPAYLERLPAGIFPDADGVFRISRPLPGGAVILPGISLVAE